MPITAGILSKVSARQVLVDGEPGKAMLLSQLGRQMPFWDRTLDVVVLMRPDADHITMLDISNGPSANDERQVHLWL